MEYDDNRSSMKLLKKLFIKMNEPNNGVNFDKEHIKRLMLENYNNLTADQQTEYRAWENVQLFILRTQNAQTKP